MLKIAEFIKRETIRASAAKQITAASLMLILGGLAWRIGVQPSAQSAKAINAGVRQKTDVATALGRLPLSFEPNRGQTDSQVKYLTRGAGYSVYLTEKEAVIELKKAKGADATAVSMRFAGAQKPASITPSGKQEGVSNYYIGARSNWVTGVPNYAQVHYKGIYPGVDAVFYGQGTRLRYDVLVNKGADPKTVALSFDGAKGATVNGKGELVLKTVGGDLVYEKPVIYQQIAGTRRIVQGGYRVADGGQVGFDVADYDRNETLVIDPVLNFSTYLGGTLADQVNGVVYNGSVYVAGQTSSLTFPVADSTVAANSGATTGFTSKGALSDAFVASLNSTGTTRQWASYYGGSLTDSAQAITYSPATGNIVIVGNSDSTDIPVSICPCSPTGQHGFAASFGSGGNWIWGTRTGGTTGTDSANSVAVDYNLTGPGTNDVYVAGTTSSTNLNSAAGGNSAVLGGAQDGYITRLTAATGATVQSTYVGGLGVENIWSIAAQNGVIYIGGDTTSTPTGALGGFPSVPASATKGSPVQTANAGGQDGFVALMPSSLTAAPTYRTFLGGAGTDSVTAVAIRQYFAENKVWVAGTTNSSGLATAGAAQATLGGGTDGFVAYITDSNTAPLVSGALAYLTYVGGSGNETVTGLSVDSSGQAYVVGQTASTGLPVTTNALQTALSGPSDGFVARIGGTPFLADFTPNGGVFSLLSYFGGAGADSINSIAINTSGPTIYFGGITDGTAGLIVSPGAYRTTPVGSTDGFVSSYAFNDLTIGSPPNPFVISYGTAASPATNLSLTFSNVANPYTTNPYTIGTVTYSGPTSGASCTGWLTPASNGATTIAITVDPKTAGCAPATGLTATFPVSAGSDNGPQTVTVTLNYTTTATPPIGVTRFFSRGASIVTKIGPNPATPVSAANTVTGSVDSFLVTSLTANLPFSAKLTFNGSSAQTAPCAGVISVAVTGPTALAGATGSNVSVTYNPSAVGDLNLLLTDGAFSNAPSCQGNITYTVPGAGTVTQFVDLDFTSQLLPTPLTGLTFTFPTNAAGSPSTQTITVLGDAFPIALTSGTVALTQVSGNPGTCGAGALTVAAPAPGTAPDNLSLLTPSSVAVTVDPSVGPCTLGATYTGKITLTPVTTATGGNAVSIPVTVIVGNAIAVINNPTLGISNVTDSTPPVTTSKPTTVTTTIASMPFQFSTSVATSAVGSYAGTPGGQAAGSATGWLRVTPATGDTTGGPVTLAITVDPTVWATLVPTAPSTTYTGNIAITSTGGSIGKGTTYNIPVSFIKYTQPINVAEATALAGPFGTPAYTPATLPFAMTVGTGGGTQSLYIQPSLTAGFGSIGTDFTADVTTALGTGYPGYAYPADGKTTLDTTGENASSWLYITPSQGATGAVITVTASLANLNVQNITSPITLTGTIRVRHGSTQANSLSGQNPVLVPVTLTVSPVQSLNLSSTAAVAFAYTQGPTTPTPTAVTVTATSNLPSTSVAFNVTPTGTANGCAWLTAMPATGSANGTTGAAITIGVNSACITGTTPALTPGTYTGFVTVNAPGAAVVNQTIPVSLVVSGPPVVPVITVAPSATANFTAQINSVTAPSPQVIAVNVGNGTIPLTLSPATLPSWLTATLTPGSPTVTSSASLTLSINQAAVNSLTASSTPITQVLTIGSTTPNVAPVTVTVNLTVSAQPVLVATPGTVPTFNFTIAGTAPASQTVTVASTSAGSNNPGLVLNAVPTTTSGGNWLSVNQSGGTTPSNLTITVIPGSLAAGTYLGNVALSSAGVATVNLPVTFVVSAQPTLSVSPAPSGFLYTINSSTLPGTQTLAISSSPAGATGLTAAVSGATCGWLTATVSGGNLVLGAAPIGLAAATYTCSVSLNGATTGSQAAPAVPLAVPVSLVVNPQPVLATSPTFSLSSPLTFAYNSATGQQPSPQIVNVSASPTLYTTGYPVTATVATTSGGSWLTVVPSSGNTTPFTLTVTATPGTLLNGTYTGTITLTGNAAASIVIPVTLNVTTPVAPFFAGQTALANGVDYLAFSNGTPFGYYTYTSNSVIYHFDLGYESIFPSGDANSGVYLYDFTSKHFWYTTPASFPNVYDFTLNSWIYYVPATGNPGHYTSSPRQFYNYTTKTFFNQ